MFNYTKTDKSIEQVPTCKDCPENNQNILPECMSGERCNQLIEKELLTGEPSRLNAREMGATPVSPVQNVPSPRTRDGYYDPQEAAWANVCGTDILEKHCLSTEGTILTNGPLKTQIIRCPKCGSSNVFLGIPENDGIPVLCYDCKEVTFVKKDQ